MKRYKVLASYVVYCTAEIEAVNEAQAYEIAQHMDGGDFYYKGIDDWDINTVDEIKEIK
jgi:hypothetical protein